MKLADRNDQPADGMSRRGFLNRSGAAGAGLVMGGVSGLAAQSEGNEQPTAGMDRVRVGFVGVGGRGSGHVRNLLKIEGVELKAVCDLVPSKVERIQNWVEAAGQPRPEGYTRGEQDYKRLCARDDLDLVFTATTWRWHTPVCVEAMNNGKHAFVEIPAALTIEQCWELVEAAERTGRHCVQVENCNYDRVELMVLNMVRKGLLGEVLHAECGYLHDLRALKFGNRGEGLWRLDHSIRRNADLYPSHGLGPVAQCVNINRGNNFDYLVAMSTKSRSLQLFAERKFGPESPQANLDIALGDVVTSVIRTLGGETIVLTHDTNTPRPYSRDVLVQGTKGIVRKYPSPKIFIEGKSPRHRWEDLMENYAAEWDHPLWSGLAERAKGAGHGGMDYVMNYRLIQCLLRGEPLDTDVYDAAALSAVIELSERSIANRGQSMDFPDFTRGKWRSRTPLGIVGV